MKSRKIVDQQSFSINGLLPSRTVRQNQVALHVRSYQEILTLAQETNQYGRGEQIIRRDSDEWVPRKTSKINAERENQKEKSHPIQHDVG